MLNIVKAILLGIIEGITEFLPISSTGHLYLANEFIKLDETKAFITMFMVVIQLGAILAVVVLYFHRLNPFSPKKSHTEKHDTWILWFKVILAVIPSMIVGLIANDWMDAHLNTWQVISATLIIYGVLFIVIERWNAHRTPKETDLAQLKPATGFEIGLFQLLSLVPGTSRSGATILGGITIGTSRYVATEFSFFLAIPTMVGASGLKLVKYLIKGNTFSGDQLLILIVGTAVSFIVAYFAIRFLLNYIKRNDFQGFGWYRIVLGLLVIAWFSFHG
ncbi:undecaprenyl-diphosphate phosphatase [Schleiferilactobacillus shenzhenensis]|uniref:Undecaprenyl-diphosphatase n=1 Tax=Schleiferilactobacillus shenzhenensis LY-73 TaxID=1231336 RepID=U4TMQ2_9LACO|nr:undecaprenyl-diphosphate phosphatase [Schleiferilactobacillus shenzhenensis]ERL66166.1 UppP [Schleiferilactobacillus shenzhenensis LY-73]